MKIPIRRDFFLIMKFEITILGCGSATPTMKRNPTAQVVNVLERLFLIDCAEGTQLQLRKYGVRFQRINHIFISHLHGDHYFGLVGLLSSFQLLGRKQKLMIYAPKGLEKIVKLQLESGEAKLSYEVGFIQLNSDTSELIFEDNLVEVYTIPLKHRIYCNGFLIKEKERERRLTKELIEKYQIPVAMMHRLKKGEDWAKENETIRNEKLTLSPFPSRSYAFCSDTAYSEKIIPIISQVDCLYHEATFTEKYKDRAKATFHSTAKQAATIALKANVKQLLIGHYSARYNEADELLFEAKEVFENSIAVEDGMDIEIPLVK